MANGHSRMAQRAATGDQPAAPRFVWPGLAAVFLLVVFIGIAAGTPAVSATGGPWHAHGLAVGLTLEAVLALLFITVRILGRRSSPRRGYPAAALRKLQQQVIAFAMAAVGLLLILNALKPHPGQAKPPYKKLNGQPGHTPKPPRPVSLGHFPHLNWLPYALLVLLAAVTVVAFAVVIMRRRRSRSPGEYLGEFPDESEELQRAVESGRHALRSVDDARAAIIACYLAMESSLAGAGAARDAAETPDELLARAAAAGLVHGAAAGRLTALFYEARYSTHPLPASARDSAQRALDEISADLTIEMAYAGQTDAGQ